MKKFNIFLVLILFGLGLKASNATAAGAPILVAPNLSDVSSADQIKNGLGVRHNARLAIAPYAQVVPNSTYTFIGVSHPSLGTAHTSIGLVVEAMDMNFTIVANNSDPLAVEKARAAIFTVNAGETHRVFIVNQGHSTINTSNAAFTGPRVHVIATSDAAQFGNIRVTTIGTEPNRKSTADDQYPKGNYVGHHAAATPAHGKRVMRYNNLNQLSMWGVVYQPSNGAGFSLEFVGDMHDSAISGTVSYHSGNGEGDTTVAHPHTLGIPSNRSSSVGRGVN